MLRTSLIYGVVAGFIVALPMFSLLAINPDPSSLAGSQFFGYALMILALSMVFIGVKSYRDKARGGVIKFLPALLVGLGISFVAAIIYVIGWEITLYFTDYAFASDYATASLESARAKGASPTDLEAMTTQFEDFQRMYANPLFRLPMTFIEIFPVGLIISLIAAALLRNPRFFPARA